MFPFTGHINPTTHNATYVVHKSRVYNFVPFRNLLLPDFCVLRSLNILLTQTLYLRNIYKADIGFHITLAQVVFVGHSHMKLQFRLVQK